MSNRWALLIGIDQYLRSNIRSLNGCVNDVQLMEAILKTNFKFPETNIKRLTNEEATRENILNALDELYNKIDNDDIVVWHYSGHGSRRNAQPDTSPSGQEETLVPYDSGRTPFANRDIPDKKIYEWLLKISEKTKFITLIFDSCHSGGITRDIFGEEARTVQPDARPYHEAIIENEISAVDLVPESRDHNLTALAPHLSKDWSSDILGGGGWLPLSDKYALIAGCRSDESSYEYSVPDSEIKHGTLTYFLVQEINKASANATYRDIFNIVNAHIATAQPKQHPQLEGAIDRIIFDTKDIEPMQFVLVKERNEANVILSAGAAQGLTINSKWAVYAETVHTQSEEEPLGTIKITTINAITCEAEILDEARPNTIKAACRAVEIEHDYGDMQLKISVAGPIEHIDDINRLKELINRSKLLVLSDDPAAQIKIYLVPVRAMVNIGDPLPQIPVVEEPFWAVVGSDGQLIMPIKLIDHQAELVGNLNLEAKYRLALALKNVNPTCTLKDKLELKLLQLKDDNNWVAVAPDKKSGMVILETGARVALQITNRHSRPVYAYIFDFGLTKRISSIFPYRNAHEQITNKQPVIVCNEKNSDGKLGMALVISKDFNFEAEMFGANDDKILNGLETFKMIVTTQPSDFSSLTQEGMKGDIIRFKSLNANRVLDLFTRALTGEGTRDVTPIILPEEEEWITVEVPFILRGKVSSS